MKEALDLAQKLLGRIEEHLADCDVQEQDILAAALVLEVQRAKEVAKQRKAIEQTTDPHTLRGLEEMYLDTIVDQRRSSKVARFILDQAQARRLVRGEPAIPTPQER